MYMIDGWVHISIEYYALDIVYRYRKFHQVFGIVGRSG